MRVLAVSDIHVDYEQNRRWLEQLSKSDYQRDVLIIAGDVSSNLTLLEQVFDSVKERFMDVVFVPGNHDVWVHNNENLDSLQKFQRIKCIAAGNGIFMEPYRFDGLSIVPLHGWYDYSFGQPTRELTDVWMDFYACKWPVGYDEEKITESFVAMNEPFLRTENEAIVSFSHFLPKIELLPSYQSSMHKRLHPVMGTRLLNDQIHELRSDVHVYGHSHLNVRARKEGVEYVNNAFGYPHETFTSKELSCVFEI